jgi:hypothetical protein
MWKRVYEAIRRALTGDYPEPITYNLTPALNYYDFGKEVKVDPVTISLTEEERLATRAAIFEAWDNRLPSKDPIRPIVRQGNGSNPASTRAWLVEGLPDEALFYGRGA